jgi:hypothetical protein
MILDERQLKHMKLIKASALQYDEDIVIYRPPSLRSILTKGYKKAKEASDRSPGMRFTGRARYTTCEIDFEDYQFVLGLPILSIKFGDELYKHVVPLNVIEGTIVECCIDFIEPITK